MSWWGSVGCVCADPLIFSPHSVVCSQIVDWICCWTALHQRLTNFSLDPQLAMKSPTETAKLLHLPQCGMMLFWLLSSRRETESCPLICFWGKRVRKDSGVYFLMTLCGWNAGEGNRNSRTVAYNCRFWRPISLKNYLWAGGLPSCRLYWLIGLGLRMGERVWAKYRNVNPSESVSFQTKPSLT